MILSLLPLFAITWAFNMSSVSNSSYTNLTQPYEFQISSSAASFQYQGIALGGWLLLEPFITPSLFLAFNETSKNVSDIPNDEYNFCKSLGKEEAARRLHAHWSGFYNETDFQDIKKYGFNMVRIPIGYWAFDMFDSDPYVSGAQDYLDLAIGWAHANDLKVWIDLHGAPGSQNGFDNSGFFRDNLPGWQQNKTNVELTESVLRQIYSKYGSASFSSRYNDTIIGIEVLNEPMGPFMSMTELESFYNNTYLDARTYQETNNTIVFHDAFQGLGYWDGFLNSSGTMPWRLQNYNILIDHHHYEIFSAYQLRANMSERIASIVNFASSIYDERHAHPAVVGEWSAALTDCTPWVNSVHYGTRWEGTSPYDNAPVDVSYMGNCSNINNWAMWSKKHKENMRKFIEIQLDQYESKSKGWIFWTYKTETTIEWDFKRLAQFGLFPQPFSDRKYIINGTDTKPDKSGASAFKPTGVLVFACIMAIVIF